MKVLKADASAAASAPGTAYAEIDLTLPSGSTGDIYIQFKVYVPAATLASIQADSTPGNYNTGSLYSGNDVLYLGDGTLASLDSPTTVSDGEASYPGVFTSDAWHTITLHWDPGASDTLTFANDGTTFATESGSHPTSTSFFRFGTFSGIGVTSEVYYIADVRIGSSPGGSEYFGDDFSSGDLSSWTSTTGDVSVIDDPTGALEVVGRVCIAFDDGPLVASPTWTRIDGGDAPFPDNFVSGYDVRSGRQTLLSQTDTGTATVYINDYASNGLFDPRNASSDFFGKLVGKQIRLQLWDPVAAAWEDQFRGHIDDVTWAMDPATDGGKSINAAIQIECVDLFDFLAGYGLTPGLDGVSPPAGGEDGVWYATTSGTNDDRMLAILTDVGIDSSRYLLASGNTHVLAVKYDPDEAALQALRDAADADLPFIANIYCDRHGKFNFRGRYSRFYPDDVAAEPSSEWDFTRWAVGDGAAITADSTRAQLRELSFARNRSDLINAALAYPQDLDAVDMPSQVYADTTSITTYGKHQAAPMSDLLLDKDATQPVTGFTGKVECFHYAKLLVENQKNPRENVTSLQVKAIRPDDARAEVTWALITKADISHIINVAVGYPAGAGLVGASPMDDYYIEGRELTVRALNTDHDYVEVTYDLSPFEWSADTHGVFANPFSSETSPALTAEFTTA